MNAFFFSALFIMCNKRCHMGKHERCLSNMSVKGSYRPIYRSGSNIYHDI